MFLGRVAAFSAGHRKAIIAVTVAIAAMGALFGAGAAEHFNPAGLEDPHSESSQASEQVARATKDEPLPGLVILMPTGLKPKKATSHGKELVLEQLSVGIRIRKVEKILEADRAVGKIRSALDVGTSVVSRDGTSTYITVQFKAGSERAHVEAARRLVPKLERIPGVKLSGTDLVTSEASKIISEDAKRAELMAFPILFLLVLWFFRGLVAAALPPILGGSAIVLTQAALRVATHLFSVSELVLIVVTSLGIGLAIDYSLLIVSRFREELAITTDVLKALERTMNSAGRTVMFSSLTVIAAFFSLLVLPQPFFYSMGLGGGMVTAIVCLAALVVLPALLALLGPRVNSLSPAWLQRRGALVSRPVLSGRWYRFAMLVMRRPVLVAIAAAAVLIAFGTPALHMKFTMPGAATMPESTSVRQVSDRLGKDFSLDPNRLNEVVTVGATPKQIKSLRHRISQVPGISSVSPREHLGGKTDLLYVTTKQEPTTPSAEAAIKRIRAMTHPYQTKTTGPTAVYMDLKSSIDKHLLLGALLVALTTCLTIFLMTGSVILPPKTLIMNSLTALAALGVLVLIFQDGFLSGLFGYPKAGSIEITQPVVLVAIVFGVSTDYGVFLIDRIREMHDAGASNEQSVALGLERTGRITTTAALLLCVAIGSLVTSRIAAAREIALGLSVAVLLDATVVRALLVPALMRILDERNWWAPAPLRRFHAWIWGRARHTEHVQLPAGIKPVAAPAASAAEHD